MFGWVNWRVEGSLEHLVGYLGSDGLLYHPASEEASGQGIGALFQHAPKDEGGVGAVTSDSGVGWGGGSLQSGDWGESVGGYCHRTAGSRDLSAPSGGQPQSLPEVGRRGLLMASGRDPQGFVLDHLKLVHMAGGYLCEPDGGSIVQDGAHNGLIHDNQGFGREAPARPSEGFHDINGPRCPLVTVASVRAEGEVGVQHDAQDLRGRVQRSHGVTDPHLEGGGGSRDWWVSDVNRVTLDFWCWWYGHDAFLPRRYATSHLTRLWQSRERWIISMRRRWETVSNAFEMSTEMAMVLLGGLRWLKVLGSGCLISL